MWWPGPALTSNFWYEAHNSPGATTTATRWVVAGGEIGGPADARDVRAHREPVGDRRPGTA